jgi:hypothetical protein
VLRCAAALAGDVKVVNASPAPDPFIRLHSHDQLRWRRGTALSFFAGGLFTLLGVAWLVAAASGVPRGWGWPILARGISEWHFPFGAGTSTRANSANAINSKWQEHTAASRQIR